MSKHQRSQHEVQDDSRHHESLSRRTWLGVAFGGAATVVLGQRLPGRAMPPASRASDPAITVYASPSCGCCHKWVKHLEYNAFRVTVEKVDDVTPFKRKLGVPEKLWSCHTAVIGRYAIEGHVPVDLIEKMLIERPQILGLAVPRMPRGAPGMDGPISDRYDVIAFKANGETEVYATR